MKPRGTARIPCLGFLLHWAKQGVLLLNATLTVREGHKEELSSRAGIDAFSMAFHIFSWFFIDFPSGWTRASISLEANSHAKCGWQTFTDAVIKALNEKREGTRVSKGAYSHRIMGGVVFLLWGNFAQKKAQEKQRKTT